MDRKFIIDKEINLNECDFLKTKVYADNLTKVIKNTDTNKVFTIGVFGSWGTGKSSIIETSKQDFDHKKVKFITYDAWQYVNDSFRRMFLRKLRENLKSEETDLKRMFYENESTDIGYKYELSRKRLGIMFGAWILLMAILLVILRFEQISLEEKFSIFAIYNLFNLLITIIIGAFHQLKISVTKPHLFAPEQFEECFKDIIVNYFKKPKLEKLVIVIDNIDRCSNDIAYNLLTDIKTFLSSEPYSIVFIIPVDDNALRKHIINNNRNAENGNKEKEEFLRKFFNVTIRIKPYGETDMFSFAKQISEKYQLNFKPETINVASKEYAKNPRRVIQLFNNLLAELNNYDRMFIQKNETLICCVLIIREEYPDYYKQLVNSPKLFCDGSVDKMENNEELKRFIRISNTAVGNIEISDLSIILTNSYNQFDNIPSDLKDSIETFDTEKVLESWNTEKERIIDFIIDRLDNAIKNQLIDTDMIAYLNLMVEVNKQYLLDDPSAKRIDEKIMPYLSTIIAKTKNYENLCSYAYYRNNQGDKGIKNILINHCDLLGHTLTEYWQPLFTAVLKVFRDKDTSIVLSPIYTKSEFSRSIDYKDFSNEQVEYLISNDVVKQEITKLPVNESNKEILLDANTTEYQNIKWLFENKQNIDKDIYGYLFVYIIGENNVKLIVNEKTIDDIAEILKFVNPLLNHIPDRKLTIEPQTLYGLIVNDRQMPNPKYRVNSYDNQPKTIPVNFIDDCISTDKHIQEIIGFVINIYRITNNNTNVCDVINKLLKRNSLDNKFMELIHNGYSLNPILDLIFDDDENYESKNNFKDSGRLTLLKHCFNKKPDDIYQIADDKAKKKIDELLIFAQSQESKDVFALLESLITQRRYETMLSDLIVNKDCNFISSLPQELLKLAVGIFKKDNYKNFVGNFDFLKVIIQHGNNNQKDLIVQIIIDKLDSNQDIEKLIDLMESMKNVSEYDLYGLLITHLKNYLRKSSDSAVGEELKKALEKQLKNIEKEYK